MWFDIHGGCGCVVLLCFVSFFFVYCLFLLRKIFCIRRHQKYIKSGIILLVQPTTSNNKFYSMTWLKPWQKPNNIIVSVANTLIIQLSHPVHYYLRMIYSIIILLKHIVNIIIAWALIFLRLLLLCFYIALDDTCGFFAGLPKLDASELYRMQKLSSD